MLCVCALFSVTAGAATDPMAEKFDEALRVLDHFYDFDYDYMIRVASDEFVSWEERGPFTATAAEFDGALRKHVAITDQQIKELRELGNRDYNTTIYNEETWEVIEVIPFFNEETQIYTFEYYGGFGGTLAPRQYLGYVKNGNTYDVYYQHITYAFLEDYLPEGVDEWEYIEDLGYPEYIELEGIRFHDGPDGYYSTLSFDNYGRKYTVEMNGDVVRILSCTDYTSGQQPDKFDDKVVEDKVIYDIPAGSDISIPENDCFDGNTVVKVEEIKSGSVKQTVDKAMESVAEKYVAYEFTATKDNVAVQPNGKLAVTFAIPSDDAATVLDELMENGYVSSAYLGVYVVDSRDGIGVFVESLVPGSCAEKAGVKSGDYIIGVGEHEIYSMTDLTKALRSFKPGDITTVRVFRGRQVLELTVTLDERPVDMED